MQNYFKKRRDDLIKNMEKGSLCLIFSNQIIYRNSDIGYPFRQNSLFYYYTGITEPDVVCFIYKNMAGETITKLYSKEITDLEKVWFGNRIDFKEMSKISQIDDVIDIDLFEDETYKFVDSHLIKTIYANNSNHVLRNKILYKVVDNASREGYYYISNFTKLEVLSSKQRVKKDKLEIENIKKSIEIDILALKHAFKNAVNNKNPHENYIISDLYKIYNDHNVTWGYPAIVATGNNANTLHYENGDKKINKGELVLVDAGCEYNYYSSDITRCFPISKKFSKAQKDVYQIVLEANLKVIEEISKGNKSIIDLEKFCSKVLIKGMIKLGVLEGSVEDNLKSKIYRNYYMHGFGHSLGLDTHDLMYHVNGDYPNKDYIFTEGAVFTVEPGLYFREDDISIPKKYRGIGIRIEDNILIKKDGVEVLTKDMPKTIDEIEKLLNE